MLLLILVYNIGTLDIVKRVTIPSLRKQRFLFMIATRVFISTYRDRRGRGTPYAIESIDDFKDRSLTNFMSSCELPGTNLTSQ